MLFTLDSVLFDPKNKKFIIFNFIDETNLTGRSTNRSAYAIGSLLSKLSSTGNSKNIEVVTVRYNSNSEYQDDSNISVSVDFKNDEYIKFKTFKETYLKHSADVKGNSKQYGAVKVKPDNYLNHLLSLIYPESYSANKLSDKSKYIIDDDMGKPLIRTILGSGVTHGFDVDIFEPEKWIVIELLKRDNPGVTNLTAHPMRYMYKNKQKFISLWTFSQLFGGEFYCINYSDEEDEPLSIIKVVDFDVDSAKFKSDIGYEISAEDYRRWLSKLNINDYDGAKEILDSCPKEIRNSEYWGNWDNSKTNKDIGTNYR